MGIHQRRGQSQGVTQPPPPLQRLLPDHRRVPSGLLGFLGTFGTLSSSQIIDMSWQSYVDDQLVATKMVKHAVICGHDGNIWAQSAGFTVSVDELKALLSKYSSTDQLAQSGLTVAGKKGTSGVHCIKTTQALIVCVYEDPIVPEQAATVTEKLGEYLIGVGY